MKPSDRVCVLLNLGAGYGPTIEANVAKDRRCDQSTSIQFRNGLTMLSNNLQSIGLSLFLKSQADESHPQGTRKAESTQFMRPIAIVLSFLSLFAVEQASGAGSDKPMALRNPAGKLCLTIKSISRPDMVMTGSFHHLVTLENRCSRAIASKVCYKNSNLSCRQVTTRPYSQETVLLGVRSGSAQFDFSYDERFLP